jgi:hypothetical protein
MAKRMQLSFLFDRDDVALPALKLDPDTEMAHVIRVDVEVRQRPVVDNGSSHRGQRAADRLQARWPNIVLVHTPVHASWLSQIEIYFSIVQRKLLNPNDFPSVAVLNRDLIRFQQRY